MTPKSEGAKRKTEAWRRFRDAFFWWAYERMTLIALSKLEDDKRDAP